jgi:hypothetical protein
MQAKTLRLPLWGILALTLMAPFPAGPAAAAGEWRANWLLDVDFVNNQPNVTLTVQVWDPADAFESHNEALTCAVSGGAYIKNARAHFPGLGRIVCDIPSLKQIVLDMTDGKFELEDECYCKADAFVLADLAPKANLTAADLPNPVFYLRDIQFSTPIPANGGLHFVSLLLAVDGWPAASSFFPGLLAGNDVLAAFSPDLGEGGYEPYFSANGSLLASMPAQIDADLAVSNVQRALYIGYAPGLSVSFQGTITSLHIDPGCFGTG